MRRLVTIIGLLLSALPLCAQTPVTVTGIVTDNSNTAATSGYVQFDIQPSSGALHYYVPGVTSVAPQTAQCGIDGIGQVKNLTILTNPCTIWGNDALTPGNSTYKVTFAPNGNVTNVVNGEKITGVSYNLNNPVFAPIVQITPQQNIIRSNPFQVNITPIATNTFNIGSPALQYANGYFQNITIGSAFSAPVLTTTTLVASGSVTTPVITGPTSFTGFPTFNVGSSLGPQIQLFSINGTFTIPVGVVKVKVTVVGAGGAGGGSTAANSGASGGAGGAAIKYLSGLTPGNTILVVVGTGGLGVSGASGNAGLPCSISSGTQVITTVTANPGTGGGTGAGTQFGGSGGSAINGDLNFPGNAGTPNLSSSATTGVSGPGSIFGGGGQNVFQGPGNPGTAPGAGGSGTGSNGAGNLAGGNGANGIVIFEWIK